MVRRSLALAALLLSFPVHAEDLSPVKDAGPYVPSPQSVVADMLRGQWSALERETRLYQAAQIDRETCPRYQVWFEQEPGSGGKESAESSIRRFKGMAAFADRVTGSKEARAEPYAAQVQAGNVSLVAGGWNRAFLEEHEQFPFGKYKDQVDAVAGAFNKLAEGHGSYDTSLSWVG